jgi:integrase
MARKIRCENLEQRGYRLDKLEARKRPYTVSVAKGIRLGYRRNSGSGTWVVLKSRGAGVAPWTKAFATADDYEVANGSTILEYDEACDMARRLARGEDGTGCETEGAGAPLTVAAAVTEWETDLADRDGRAANAAWLRFHLEGTALNAKPVALMTKKEIRVLRRKLLDSGLKPASANRWMKSFAAAMNLAATDDPRITNHTAWTLKALPGANKVRVDVVLTDDKIRALVAACYAIGGPRFGAFIEVLAVLGPRPVQARRLKVRDLDGARIAMPSAKKGKREKKVEHAMLPISRALAAKLKVLASNRGLDEALLVDDSSEVWTENGYPRLLKTAAVAAGVTLPKGTVAYVFRHSAIVRDLLGRPPAVPAVPVRLVAAAHDTSVREIEETYSKFIVKPGADLLLAAQLDLAVPARAA